MQKMDVYVKKTVCICWPIVNSLSQKGIQTKYKFYARTVHTRVVNNYFKIQPVKNRKL